ncbi:MAG: ABC transporter permease [Halieaceae bacterium]|jgi:lipopolysaccharide transport system permease protein|nr:ABC transporter permease [Halieaceae bacterium]
MTLRHFWMLADEMARMALKADASRLYLGYVWWVLEPLLYVAVFYLVFDVLLESPRADFLAFLMCGKLTFVWFSKSVVHASRSILAAKGLIGKIDLPKALFPIASIQQSLYKQLAVFALLFVFLVATGHGVSAAWLWLPLIVVVNYLLIAACAMAASAMVCVVEDVAMLVGLAMVFLLFSSGIFWDPRALDPQAMELLFTLNPIAFLLDAYRQVLMAGVAPDWVYLVVIGLISAGACAVMVLIMHRSSRFLALRAITS